MKQGQGKNKGSSFERLVCKELSTWVSSGHRTDLFARSASSGGMFTNQRKFGHKNRTQGGDICAVGEAGHALTDKFSIECKHVKNLQLEGAFLNRTGCLIRFWEQAQRDASAMRKRPLLIAKQNPTPSMVIASVPSLIDLVPDRLIRVQFEVDRVMLGIVLLKDMLAHQCPF